MHILFDARVLARGGTSGIEEYARNLFRALRAHKADDRYTVWYTGMRNALLREQLPGYNAECGSIEWRLPNKALDLASRVAAWPDAGAISGANVIVSPHFNVLAAKNTPRIITVHDLSFMHHPDFFSWKQRAWHWLQNVTREVHAADAIIAVSHATKSDLVNLCGVPEEKISVIYSGIDPMFTDAQSAPTHTTPHPYLLYLGTLEPRKNVPALVRAFSLMKTMPAFRDLKLVLAGKKGWLFHAIFREIAASPHRSDILVKGQVASHERPALYRNALAFVYPSFFEGFGFPPLEAQASGCPVIAADRTSLPEILGDSAVFVNPWRVSELAGAMAYLAGSAAARKRLIAKGARNSQRFSWEKATQETHNVISRHAR